MASPVKIKMVKILATSIVQKLTTNSNLVVTNYTPEKRTSSEVLFSGSIINVGVTQTTVLPQHYFFAQLNRHMIHLRLQLK